MYAPHELERTPKALELVGALRDADAVVVGSPGYHGAVSGLVKNALDYIEDLREDPRVYLDNTPWGCISCAYGWQAAVGTLGQLRSIGHALRAWPTPLGVAINSADQIWDCRRSGRRRGCAEPTRHAGHPGAHLRPCRVGNGVIEAQRKTVLVDGLVTGYLEAGQGDPVVLLHGGEFGVSAELGWEHNIAALAAHYRVLALGHAGLRAVGEGDRLQRRARHADPAHRAVLRCGRSLGSRTSSATRWVRSTCSSTRRRKPRCCPPRSLTMICGGGEIQRNEHSAALYDYDATPAGHARIVEALFSDPSYPNDDAYVHAALRVQHRARRVGGVGSGAISTAGPGAAAAAVEQAAVRPHRRADAGRRGCVRQAVARRLGRRNRRADCRTAARLSSRGQATARRSSNPMPSTNCCWTSSAVWLEKGRQASEQRTGGQGRDRHRRGVGTGRGDVAAIRRRRRQGADRRHRRRCGCGAGRRHRWQRAVRRGRCVATRPDRRAGDRGGRSVRRTARDGQQRRSVEHDAPQHLRR